MVAGTAIVKDQQIAGAIIGGGTLDALTKKL